MRSGNNEVIGHPVSSMKSMISQLEQLIARNQSQDFSQCGIIVLNDLITAFDISMLESICTLEEELSV
jgi:hypothetical protein